MSGPGRRLWGPVLAALAGVALWFGWREIGLLRGTALWDLRFLALLVAGALLLTLLDRLAARLSSPPSPDDPSPPHP